MSDRGRSSRHGVSTPGNGAGLTKLGDVDSLPAMVWLADGDRQLLDANAAWRRFEGSDASTTWDAGIHPEDAPRCCAAFARAVAAAQEFRLRYRRRRSDGAYRWLFDVATPRPDPETGALHYLGTLLEIDDTRHADDLAAAHRATRDLMEVAEAASHDMREPLASATICAELIKRQNAEGMHSGTGELIGHVQKAVATMYRSLEELVAYLRLERDSGEGVMAPADCDVVVRGVVESLAEALEKTGGSIRVGGKLPVVAVDEGPLQDLFQHLLDNALKFHGNEPPRVEVSAQRAGNEWVFTVRDNGKGIEPSHTEQVFKIFKRLNGFQYSGSGMGLAMCRKIVENHGGRIWVESEPGCGSTFTFTLPVADDA